MTADQIIDRLRTIDRRLWWINELVQNMNETIDTAERERLESAARREIERLHNDTESLFKRTRRSVGRPRLSKAS